MIGAALFPKKGWGMGEGGVGGGGVGLRSPLFVVGIGVLYF